VHRSEKGIPRPTSLVEVRQHTRSLKRLPALADSYNQEMDILELNEEFRKAGGFLEEGTDTPFDPKREGFYLLPAEKEPEEMVS
jgi:hypothetical protein